MICKLPCVIKGAGSDINNNPPPLYSFPQAVNTSLYAYNVSFSRTQKRKFVRLEFLLFCDSMKICTSLFVLYDKYMHCTLVQVCKSNKDFQLNKHTVINRLRAIWPKGYQRGSLRKSHQNGDYLKASNAKK